MESERPRIRKQPIGGEPNAPETRPGEIDLAADALFQYTSEDSAHPVENLVDGQDGPTGTRWVAATADQSQTILLALDRPRSVARLRYEVNEPGADRSQEVRIEASSDGGNSYQTVHIQEYNFSPNGATFQVEDLILNLYQVTHLRLTVTPNKRGSGRATLTSLRLFEA